MYFSPTRELTERKQTSEQKIFSFQSNAQSQVVPLTPQRSSPLCSLCCGALGAGTRSESFATVWPHMPHYAPGRLESRARRGAWTGANLNPARLLQAAPRLGLEKGRGQGSRKAATTVLQSQAPSPVPLGKIVRGAVEQKEK